MFVWLQCCVSVTAQSSVVWLQRCVSVTTQSNVLETHWRWTVTFLLRDNTFLEVMYSIKVTESLFYNASVSILRRLVGGEYGGELSLAAFCMRRCRDRRSMSWYSSHARWITCNQRRSRCFTSINMVWRSDAKVGGNSCRLTIRNCSCSLIKTSCVQRMSWSVSSVLLGINTLKGSAVRSAPLSKLGWKIVDCSFPFGWQNMIVWMCAWVTFIYYHCLNRVRGTQSIFSKHTHTRRR